jgi:ribosomal protein L4
MESDDIKTARVVLDLLVPETQRAHDVLTKIAASLDDEPLKIAIESQAKTLKLAAEQAQQLVLHLTQRP